MKRFDLTRRALRDLQDVWEFISKDSFDTADQVLETSIGPSISLRRRRASDTNARISRPEMFASGRSTPLVIYKASKPLRIVRIIHSRRDVKRMLKRG